MKILHTGDWHIGKIINDFSMLNDQKYILDQFFDIISDEKPDVIIISGDIYDRSIPPKEAVELLDNTLTRLIEDYKIPTLIVSGNHDSHERLSFGNRLLEHKKLYIEGVITPNIKKVTLEDSYGLVNFYMLPYAHPAIIRNVFEEETVLDHQDAFKVLINKLKEDMNFNERNILITHNYLISSMDDVLLSESERSLSVGGTEYIDVSLVEDFDYVALGHLHQGQKVKEDYVRYSGSLLKYSFSEVNRKKGVVVAELKEKGNYNYRQVVLTPKKDMIVIEGKLNTLISPAYYQKIDCSSYILAKLTDTTDLYDPLSSLRAIYPNLMQIQRNHLITNVNSQTKASSDFKRKSKLDLFEEFYTNVVCQNLDEKRKTVFKSVVDEVIKGDGQVCD
ncbi:exonuclease SbcCD subunit D [Mycoplasmatota bacterium]|nr:exonuclease SbcCD subunit D [Mycoplasmatota bacterium]